LHLGAGRIDDLRRRETAHEVKAGTGYYNDDERRARVRVLKRWIAQNGARLRVLWGAKESNADAK
jgi:hypothetical protein